jgi:hypothetical protein
MVETCSDLMDLQPLIAKIPHQMSFVNKKHALDVLDEEAKYRSYRCIYMFYSYIVYWFY